MKLFCLAYAGGSATTIFSKWKKLVGEGMDIIPLEYKGRGTRYNSQLEPSFNKTVDYLFDDLSSHLKGKETYAIYGHSLGALLAYELCKKIEVSSFKSPERIFLASSKAPIYKSNFNLSDLKGILRYYGGTPNEILENEDIFDYFKPILLNDFGLFNDYSLNKTNKSNVKATILYGTEDNTIDIDSIRDWEKLFTSLTDIVAIDGDHFFINDNEDAVLKIIEEELSSPTDSRLKEFL